MIIVNYYYLSLAPIVFAFRKFPLKNIIIGRAVFSTIVNNLNTEICNTPNLCVAVLNTNDHDPFQIFYLATFIYLVNFVRKESTIKDEEKRLDIFTDYHSGRRIANSLLIIWAILFTKNVSCAF